MGLVIHSLEMLSPQADREYYIYILDYGWDEPLCNIIRDNFYKLSALACKTKSAVIIGTGEDIGHFDDEVLSWHSINGEDATDLLPAILITKTNPHQFKNRSRRARNLNDSDEQFKFVLIPLRKCCKSTADIMPLITSIFKDIQNKKDLTRFQITQQQKQGVGRAIVDSIILEPNFHGIGFSFKKFREFMR